MKIPITILLLASLFAASCGEPPMPPSDEEMIRHFATHERAFRKVYGLISEGTEGSYHYPPSRPDTADSVSLRIFEEIHGTPDSLLGVTGCDLIHFDRRKREETDSAGLRLTMVYYSHGIVDAGTSKSFVYDPGLRSRRNIRITEHGDLNEIYRRMYNDTTLYKPVKEGWYIKLDHSR